MDTLSNAPEEAGLAAAGLAETLATLELAAAGFPDGTALAGLAETAAGDDAGALAPTGTLGPTALPPHAASASAAKSPAHTGRNVGA
ncbi:MAG: hypothetical protein ACHQ7M_06540 [Chloroflexota bacterium]